MSDGQPSAEVGQETVGQPRGPPASSAGPKTLNIIRIDPVPEKKAALIQLRDSSGALYIWPVKAKQLRDAMWEVMENNRKSRSHGRARGGQGQ